MDQVAVAVQSLGSAFILSQTGAARSARLENCLVSRRLQMKRVLVFALAAAVVLPFHARAQAKPDFSGTWTLDTAKSDPAPQGRGGGGGGAGSITIKQTGAELAVTSEGRQGPQTMTYK